MNKQAAWSGHVVCVVCGLRTNSVIVEVVELVEDFAMEAHVRRQRREGCDLVRVLDLKPRSAARARRRCGRVVARVEVGDDHGPLSCSGEIKMETPVDLSMSQWGVHAKDEGAKGIWS
jgi:hypothetical protein